MTARILSTAHGTNREAFSVLDWALFLGVGTIWGSSFVFIAVGLEAFEPGLITWLRVAFGAAVLWLVPAARRGRVATEDRARLVALSFLWVAIPFTLFPIAQQWVESAVVGMLNGAVPVLTAVATSLLLRRLPGRVQLLGLGLGFAGIASIALPTAGEGSSELVGVVLVLLATVCYGIAITIAAPIQQRYGSLAVMARVLSLAALWTAPLGALSVPSSDFAWASLGSVAALGVFGSGIAFALMGTLVGRVGSTRASFATYLIPVVAMALGVWLRGDDVGPLGVVGVALVIAGAVLASRREGRRVAVPVADAPTAL
ncbi:MAG TPA: DMT family transporter [Actinomycetota bacterium]|nr:DMT family transporter [Actinomycetota bacterium]